MKSARAAALVVGLACAACFSPPPRSTPALGGVERVVVVDHLTRETVATITEPARVEALVAFVNARRDGWTTPWYGVPVPRVSAEFHSAKAFEGSFGAGAGFFETNRTGGFHTRDADESELSEFARIVGIDVERLCWPESRR